MDECERNADVTASIQYILEHVFGTLGITQGHFDHLISFIEVLMLNAAIENQILMILQMHPPSW